MAHKEVWDFNCPQFVDFVEGLNDSNSKEEIYFDCKGQPTPDKENRNKSSPVPGICLTEEMENRLIDKMTASLSVIENTPKLKKGLARGKLFSEKTPNVGFHVVKPVIKPFILTVPTAKTRCWSTAVVNKTHTDHPMKPKMCGLHKRSSSLNDLRKKNYPMTPLCLKRTMNSKKVFKTTEEMELEKIAQLQKQTIQHLRNNEISYKKLKLRPRLCINQKNVEKKPDHPKGMNAEKNARRNIQMLSHAAIKSEVLKIDTIINNKEAPTKAVEDASKNILKKSRDPSAPCSLVLEENNYKCQVLKRNLKYGFHSGLVFHNNKKMTVVKPFSFDSKKKEMKDQNTGSDQTGEVYPIGNGKENIPDYKIHSVVKNHKEMQIIKHNIKQFGLNKETGRYRNSVRGMPLAENFTRN